MKAFFPAVREFVYNPNVKNALVLKAYDIMGHRRLEFDPGHTDIAQSFIVIRRATTASGNHPTYEASRSEEANHADLAWATMHALFNEPLLGEAANTSNIVEIFLMSEHDALTSIATVQEAAQQKNRAHAGTFSFGDPISVLDRRELLDYVEWVQMDKWYEPPVSFDGLARTYRAAVHHSSPIALKRNILTSTFIPHPLLSQQAFSRFVQDYLVFGNAYLEKRTNRLGGILSLEPSLAKYTRRGIDLDTYWFVQYGMTTQPYEFIKGSIFHPMEPDLNQEIYGLPEYLSARP